MADKFLEGILCSSFVTGNAVIWNRLLENNSFWPAVVLWKSVQASLFQSLFWRIISWTIVSSNSERKQGTDICAVDKFWRKKNSSISCLLLSLKKSLWFVSVYYRQQCWTLSFMNPLYWSYILSYQKNVKILMLYGKMCTLKNSALIFCVFLKTLSGYMPFPQVSIWVSLFVNND